MKTVIALLLAALPAFSFAQQDPQAVMEEMRKLSWQEGQGVGQIAKRATIAIPKDHVFLDSKNTRRFLELTGNPPRDENYTFAPASMDWFAIFSFSETGYIKDDEKIDPDDLLRTLKQSDGPGNDERKRLGMSPIHTDGWQIAPHYDPETKRLEWGVRLKTDSGQIVVNYTARLLGRTGVMSATLVSDPNTLSKDIAEFKRSLEGFSYAGGEKYSEFKQGDKIAEYGLAALIVGGAAALATKKGFWGALVAFFAAFWKLIAGVVIALLAGLRSFFKRKKSE
jgi:uncharacterized membrane-anchored protein